MRPARRLLLLASLALLLSLGLAGEAAAQITHVVERGDTLSRVAQRYYGSARKASYVAGVNRIPMDGELKVGQRLKIAVVWTYRVRRGDRLSAIARKVLGDERRYTYLARINDIEEVGRLSPGTRLLIPIEVRHKAVRGENLGIIAKHYYNNTRQAKLLRDYNFIGKKGFSTGDVIVVPIFDRSAELSEVQRRIKDHREAAARATAAREAAKPASKAGKRAATAEPDPAPEPEAEEAPAPVVDLEKLDAGLRRSLESLDQGAYEEVVELLEPLLDEVPESDLTRQRDLRLALATALVALGRRGEASSHLQRLIELDPDTSLDPVATSPKILQAFGRAQEAWAESSMESAAEEELGEGEE
ncbi:MAG: LysM domain-containing protein [Deltaproteobacteria bacterium]|nr:LysM domain-containing protein [Deltaproteobacteria bacterium]